MSAKPAKSCLIVDDSGVVRRVARRIAEEMGFLCEEAGNGLAAYESCRKSMPDAIILDWNMPVMDGLEFMKKLREEKGGGVPKIVFCTVEKNPEKIQKAMQSGANEYIIKPFDHEIIRTKFKRLGLIEK